MRGIAAFPGTSAPQFVDAPAPNKPAAGQILCRTLELGVCGTDREILLSCEPFAPSGQKHLVLGHECLARVEEVGSGVANLRSGDLVVPIVRRPSAELMAARPREQGHRVDMLAFGAFTERGIVCEDGFSLPYWLDEPQYVFPIDPAMQEVAVLVEPVAVAEKGIHEALLLTRARLGGNAWPCGAAGGELVSPPAPRVLVTGLGPIAFASVLSSRARGWPTIVYGRDRDDSFRATLVRSFGAHYTSIPLDQDLSDFENTGYDLVLECTGSDEVMLRAASATRSRGAIVWLGSTRHPTPTQHNVARLMRDGLLRNHLHIGCVNAAPRDFEAAIKHLDVMFRLVPDAVRAMITARVAPDDALWHYEHRQPQGIKTVVEFAD